jgi:PKD repeat protein
MFTYLQAFAMRGTLASSVAGRNNLADPANVAATGALAPWPDLPPTADFSTNLSFVCPNQNVMFTNRSWNDTVSVAQWTFPNGAASANSTSLTTVTNNFSTPGWTSVKLKVTGNSGSGTGTITKADAIYVANPNAVDPTNYMQEFGPSDMTEYPMFNYYGNDHKWEQVSHAGYYDNTSIRYRNYDSRMLPATLTGTPLGDYDDFYTPAFDLTRLQAGNGSVYLNFYSSGAFRTNNIQNMGDVLEISYSTNCNVWINLKSLTNLDIGNNGLRLENFAPLGFWEWKPQSIELNPSLVSQDKVYFRFRFKPGVDTVSTNANQYMLGTGNNFYIDRLHLAKWTTAVSELEMSGKGITVAPNPTTGSSSVMIMDNTNNTAQIVVTDITGKVVFTTHEALNKGITNIEIPAGYITARGVYMVQVTTGTLKHTEKLVVY